MPKLTIQSRRYQEFRADRKADWQAVNAACAICGQRTIDWEGEANASDSFELHHTPVSRKRALAMGMPELLVDPTNAQPSHSRCNRALGAGDAAPGLGEMSETY